jgi:hypothetical protein
VLAGRVVLRPLYAGLRALAGLARAGAIGCARSPTPPALDAVALGRPGGAQTTLVSNYAATPRWVTLEASADGARAGGDRPRADASSAGESRRRADACARGCCRRTRLVAIGGRGLREGRAA